MDNDIYKSLANDIAEINTAISQAKELISAMKEAGEDTHEFEADLKTLEIRKVKWERMLKARGISI